MADRVFMRCAELLAAEFPPYPFARPTWGQIERFCGSGEEGIARVRELHKKVKLIRGTALWAGMPGYAGLGDVEVMWQRARAQWVNEVRRPDDPFLVHSEFSGGRVRQAALVGLQQPGARLNRRGGGVGEPAWRRLVRLLRTGMNGATVGDLADAMGIEERGWRLTRIREVAASATVHGVAVEVSSQRLEGGLRRVYLVGAPTGEPRP